MHARFRLPMVLALSLATAQVALAQSGVVIGPARGGDLGPGTLNVAGRVKLDSPVEIVGHPLGTPSYKNDTWLGVTGPDGAFTTIDVVAFDNGKDVYPGIQLELYGCDFKSMCPVGANKVVGAVGGDAFNGKGDTTDAALLFRTTEAQTLTRNGMDAEFWYTPNGSTALTLGMALSKGGLGGVTIGNPAGGAGGDVGPGTLNAQGGVYVAGRPVMVSDAGGHLAAPGDEAPKACGALASGSTDNAGEVSSGGAVSACAVVFHHQWSRRPFCTATAAGPGAGEVWLTQVSSAGFTFNTARPFAGPWSYTCL